MQHDMEDPVIYPGIYATDLLANRSLAWLDIAAKEDAPFFLAINPVNPHANSDWNKGFTPPIPAERYKNDFPGVKVPRTANFNPDKVSMPRSRISKLIFFSRVVPVGSKSYLG